MIHSDKPQLIKRRILMIKEDDNEKDATIDDNKRQIETKYKLSNAESNLKKDCSN